MAKTTEGDAIAIRLSILEWCLLAGFVVGPAIFIIRADSRGVSNSAAIRSNSNAIEQLAAAVSQLARHDERLKVVEKLSLTTSERLQAHLLDPEIHHAAIREVERRLSRLEAAPRGAPPGGSSQPP